MIQTKSAPCFAAEFREWSVFSRATAHLKIFLWTSHAHSFNVYFVYEFPKYVYEFPKTQISVPIPRCPTSNVVRFFQCLA